MPDTISPKPLDGKTTIDEKMFFEPERLGYESVVEIATKIADQVHDEISGHIVVIAGTAVLADFANLQAVYGLLDNLLHDYQALSNLAAPAPQAQGEVEEETSVEGGGAVAHIVNTESFAETAVGSLISPATTLAGATLGLVSLFRSDVEYHGEKTAIDTLAFEIALAGELRTLGECEVFVPDLTILTSATAEHRLEALLNEVQEAKADVWAAIRPSISKLVSLEGALDDALKKKNQELVNRLSGELSALRADLAPISDPLARLDQRLSDLQNQWNEKDPSTGLLQMARLLRAEALQAQKPLYLHASVVSSGGYYRITRNLFRTLFMGDGLSFAGGATVRWALLAEDGSIEKGGIFIVGKKARFSRRKPPEQF